MVAINRFVSDTPAEIELVKKHVASAGGKAVLCDVWAKGGDGAIELGEEVIQSILHHSSPSHPYDYAAPIMDKINDITSRIYGAKRVDYSKAAKAKIAMFEKQGYTNPVSYTHLLAFFLSITPKPQRILKNKYPNGIPTNIAK